MDNKSKLFEREIQLIQDEELRDFVRWFFDAKVGDWFWEVGASSSGKYHPIFSQGKGGLVRHSRSVALICEELLRMNTYAFMRDDYKDYARVACLLHDVCKYGKGNEFDRTNYSKHGAMASDLINEAWVDFFGTPAPELLLMAVRSHMGQWTEDRDDRPFTSLDRLVHLSDYIASRSFWDIPSLTAEYEADTKEEIPDDELPF